MCKDSRLKLPLTRNQKGAIVAIIIFLLLNFVIPPVGLIGAIVGAVIFIRDRKRQRQAAESEQEPPMVLEQSEQLKQEPQKSKPAPRQPTPLPELTENTIFPERDPDGNRLLAVYDTAITGTVYKKDGVDPQDIIPTLKVGDELVLEADPLNAYDEYATRVKTLDGCQIGWMPRHDDYATGLHADVAKRLNDGLPVLARVKKIYKRKDGTKGVVIYVGRYARPNKNKKGEEKMNKKLLKPLAAVAAGAVFVGGVAYAASGLVSINVEYDNIKIAMDGTEFTPTDANGNEVEPFIYNGTTYLPVRAVGEAVGKDVSWDETTKTVSLNTPAYQSSANTVYGIGDTWTVDGQWSLTITGVTETSERNEYSDQNPAAVYIVDYTYTNLGYTSDIIGGLCFYFPTYATVVDSTGLTGYDYFMLSLGVPETIPVGATCNAQTAIGVDHAGDFTLTVSIYDNTPQLQTATFSIPVN